MSQARTWPSLYDRALRQRAAALRLVQCPRALLAARSVVGHLSASAARLLLHAAMPAHVQCGAIRVAAPPFCPFSLPWPLGPVLPPVCSPSFALLCPPSQVPWSLALGVSVLVLPLPSRHTVRGATREAPLSLPLHLAALWRPGSARPSPLPAALFSRPTSPSPPALFPLYSYMFTLRRTRCRRVARMSQARISLPVLAFPLSSLRRTLRRTPCRHVARTSQART